MGCLYCGKEISAIRQLREQEFCSDDHRKAHTSRLRKALRSLAEPEPPPAGVAGFIQVHGALEGYPSARPVTTFEHCDYPLYGPVASAVRVDAALGGDFRPFELQPINTASRHRDSDTWASTLTCSLSPHVRVTALAVDTAAPDMAAVAAPANHVEAVMAAPIQMPALAVAGRRGSVNFEPKAVMTESAPALPFASNPAIPPDVKFLPETASPIASGPSREPVLPAIRLEVAELGCEALPGLAPARAFAIEAAEPRHAQFLPEPAGPLAPAASLTIPSLALGSARPEAAGPQPFRVTTAISESGTLLAAELALSIPVEFPRSTVEAAALQGLPAAKQQPVTFRMASGAQAPVLAREEAPRPATVQPAAGMEVPACKGIGEPCGSVTLPAHATCPGPTPVLASAVATLPGGASLPRPAAVGSVIPSAEFLQALDEAGRPPEAGLLDQPAQPAVPASAAPALAERTDFVLSITRPPALLALPEILMPAGQRFLAAMAELAAGRTLASGSAPFVAAAGDAWLPSLPFGLAQPPAPHAADLSPDAALAVPVPSKAKPKWAAAGTTLPGFSLRPELLPITGLPVPIARPAYARPMIATPFIGVTTPTAMPAPPATVEATGMEALFAPMPPQIADFAPVSAQVANSWMPVHDALPPISPEERAALDMAPAAAAWPVALPEGAPSTDGVSLEFVPGNTGSMPQVPAPAMSALAPRPAGPIAVELFVQRGRTTPSHSDNWVMPRIELALPSATISPVPFSVDQAQRKSAQPESPKVRTMPRARSERTHWAQGIAAAVAVFAFLYFGSVALRTKGGETREIASAPSGPDPIALKAVPVEPHGGGMRQKVHRAIANRAKLEVGTDFRNGTDFWNGSQPNVGKGWQRHPDGYTKPGALALLRPTMQLTDYRMEFLGQIENKSMSWAVRAHDTDNYYAMKLNVVAPGLRPIISVMRYAVVNGKRGRRVEVPLPVMVHNNRPYHVAVEVKGNRFLTSVEGELVDTFTDDSLAVGGVGFFSDGAERSRLYWVKVTNNDDLLGRICAYITGKRGGPSETAFTTGGSFDGGTRRRSSVETAGVLPWERNRRRRAGLGWTTSAQAV